MATLVSGKDVSRLNNHALRAVINELLTAESNHKGIPLADLDLTLRDTDPDAGIDGRIVWPKGAVHDVLRPGTIVAQYKSGKLKKGEIRTEFLKKGVQQVLKKPKGQYILFVAHDYVAKSRDKHRKSLKGLCKARGIDPKRCTILYGDQIGRWISRFLSVVFRPELGKGYPAFVIVEQWQQQRNLSNPFKTSPERDDVVEQLRAFASSLSDDNTFRVEGQAGIGKTRLVLEALRVPGFRARTIYCPDADDPNALQLLALMQAEVQASVVMVLDECDRERQEVLQAYADLAGGRLRLVCIGQSDKILGTPTSSGQLFQLKPLPEEEMRSIVGDYYSGAPSQIVDTAVRLSGGMPKLAIFIADTLVKRQSLPLSELVDIPDVRSFLERFVDKETFDSLKGLSLLAKVGWDAELEIEAKTISEKALHLPFHQMQKSVKKLRDQGVVLSRGKYLYVSPDLLAISAASVLWDERGVGLISIIEDLPSQGPRRQLLRRLALMTDFPTVRLAIERLLSPTGLYKSIEDLDQAFLAEIFRYLTAALPELGQQALDRIFATTSEERLKGFKTGRREVMWALESLLRWPQTSLAAARILCRLALAETETVSNNATGIFQQYFHAFLSGSPIPLEERLKIVWQLIDMNEPQARLLAVKASAGALAFYEMRMGGEVDELSQRTFPNEWKPKTWEELWDARRIAINQLSVISTGGDEAGSEAREALYQSVFTLLRHGQAKDAVSVLRNHPPQNDKDRREQIDAAQRLLNEANKALGDDERRALERIISESFGTSYFDRLRRWVGKRTHSDYDLTGGTQFSAADQKGADLADEGFTKGIAGNEISWLASPDAENVWAFGKRLGELDTERHFLERIRSATPANLNCMLLSSYLIGLAASVGRAALEEILNDLENTDPAISFVATWRTGPSEQGARRVIRLMETGRIDATLYRAFQYGSWVESVSRESATRIVELMLLADIAVTSQPALAILDRITRAHPDALGDLEELVWKALESAPINQGTHAEWQWGELAGRTASQSPAKIAQLVLGRLERGPGPRISSDPVIQVLSTATGSNPENVLQLVGRALLRSDAFSFRLLLALEKWYGDLIPGATLVRWAKKHQPKGPVIAAQLINIGAPLSERARELISAFPDNQKILSVFTSNLHTGSFWGPISRHLEGILEIAHQWERDPDLGIKAWAQRLASQLTKQIGEQKVIEEGEEL